jgi:hypothetical protein
VSEAAESFESYYEREIAPQLEPREAERRKAVRAWVIAVGVGVGIALSIFNAGGGLAAGGGWSYILALMALVSGFAVGASFLGAAAVDAKALLMAKTAQFAGVTYAHRVEDASSIHAFGKHRLTPEYDRSRFEDFLAGERAGAPFELYEAHLERRRTDAKGRTHYATAFRGQLIRVLVPMRFLGVTIVLRDAGPFNALIQPGARLKRVGLVDPTFEKVFEVFGSDQVEARYLLTPDFMERLLKLESLLKGKKLRAAFAGGELLIAVEGGNLFEPGSMFRRLDDPERAGRLLAEIRSVQEIVDALMERSARPPPVH